MRHFCTTIIYSLNICRVRFFVRYELKEVKYWTCWLTQLSVNIAVSDTIPEFGIKHLLRVVGDEMLSGEPILRLASQAGDGSTVEEISVNDDLLFLIPGIEGKY